MIDFNKVDTLLKGAGLSEVNRKKTIECLITYMKGSLVDSKKTSLKDQYIQQIIQMFRKNPDLRDEVFYNYISFAMDQCNR